MITMRTMLLTITMRTISISAITFFATLILGCDDGVLNFPQPAPANVRVVNVTQDVATLGVEIDGDGTLLSARGGASQPLAVPAGRRISLVFKNGDSVLGRDTLRLTFGGGANVILFAKGTKANLIDFRQPIQDTNVTGSLMAFVRFTHMSDFFDKAGFVELWLDNGQKVFDNIFEPGITARDYAQLSPGTYSFVLREEGTGTELARLNNVQLSAGTSYMLFSYDAAPPIVDSIALNVFN